MHAYVEYLDILNERCDTCDRQLCIGCTETEIEEQNEEEADCYV